MVTEPLTPESCEVDSSQVKRILGLLLLGTGLGSAGSRLGVQMGMGIPVGGLEVYHRASPVLGLDIGLAFGRWAICGELTYGGVSGGVRGYEVEMARIGGYLSHAILPLGQDELRLGVGGGAGYIKRGYLGGEEEGWASTGKLGFEFVRTNRTIQAGPGFEIFGLWDGVRPAILIGLKLRLGYLH